MTDPKSNREFAAVPTRAITYTTDDPNQPADQATDPHAAEQPEPMPATDAAAEEPAARRARKAAE